MVARLLTISVCLLGGASTVAAQEPLTLADATRAALAKNHDIRLEREGVAAADARMLGARGDYDPQLHFVLNARHSKVPVTTLFSGAPGDALAPTQNTFDSSLSVSQLFKSGATATLSTAVAREGTNIFSICSIPPTRPPLASTCGSPC